ncbi:MAG: hypothetical protein M3N51_07190 [Actinomycetota bacterium]|nr:hypothetical protein [Actinomycetota bacterium]
MVLLVRRLLRDPSRGNATLLGAAMAGALLSDLTIAIYALLVGTAYLALQLPRGDRPPGLLRCLLGSVLVFTLVSSPLLAAMGHSAAKGALWEAYEVRGSSAHSLDVASFFIAGRHHPVLGPLQEDLRSALHRKGVETGYLGLVIVALAVLGWAHHRRQRKAQDLAWLAAAALLLSLGPRLLVLGRSFVPLPIHLGTASEPVSALMPYTWVQAAPVLANLRVPSRTLLVAALPLALLAALAVQRLLGTHAWMKVGVWAIPPLVLFEALSPMPTHVSTTLPPVYRIVAQDPDDSAIVVDVPLGFRTGLTTIGRQTGPPLIYAVGHGKRVAVGMVSRLPLQRIGRVASIPLYRDLIQLQSPFGRGKATQIAPTEGAASAAAHNLKYVVVRLDVPGLQAVRSYLEAACFRRMGTGEKFELFRFEC